MNDTPQRRRFGTWPAVLALGLSLLGPGQASAGEAFYLLMFGSQQTPNDPDYAHTFATFVRHCWPGDGPCPPGGGTLEARTISWLPSNLVVRTLALRPECGYNFDLHTTIRYALKNDERVSLWGPYPIRPELYWRAVQRIAELESGQIDYKANDAGYNTDRVSNCIHAVSAVARGLRLRVLSPGWGEVASYAVLLRLEPWVLSDREHYWVGTALGLDMYPIIYRRWEPPLSGTFLGPVNRLFGGERDKCPTYGPPRR